MIIVTGEFRMPRSMLDSAREAMAAVIAASRAEAGCLGYAYAEDVLEPGLFRVTECWTDRAALDAHFRQPHMTRWQAVRADLWMTERRVTAYEVDAGEAL
ncbi:putative quinol monooxygenase [Novosphingobium mangrovi (ex Huang et al. 2023)]|uniref:Antibiotic biosynthesis monooxygenase n=1 Tax=Novosphingobium mangrovi (ex Huang et al. 2023) TaxID=2976432 RepID=A0ABT2I0D3_9SPHN|nr:putative quinol monooxygenase [Novosphingobium mangrovi (ex Huang et al. 2023)]MCT2398254.1 antibiotic biosynthesis monooxygenase [Novosphingobium mangrovi (ex Huang et al. 2023)]